MTVTPSGFGGYCAAPRPARLPAKTTAQLAAAAANIIGSLCVSIRGLSCLVSISTTSLNLSGVRGGALCGEGEGKEQGQRGQDGCLDEAQISFKALGP